MDLKETNILGDDIGHHWYYSSKAKAMAQLISELSPNTILDVGAGSAFFSRYLLQNTTAKEAWCVDISYDNDFNDKEVDKPLHFLRSIESLDADLVLLMDVLEHVEDDVGLLKEYVDVVPAGSEFLISVPAFQFLWSGHDEFLEHKRRYTLSMLEGVVEKSGLKVERGLYYFGAVFPIASAIRLSQTMFKKGNSPASQLTKHSATVNSILKTLCYMELPFMKLNRIAGLSIFCLAKKV